MPVSEEKIAALEAQVAELVGILEVIDDDGSAKGIGRYAEQVDRIGLAAGDAGLPELQAVCLLFQKYLADLDAGDRNPGAAERERLEEWPILVMGYLGDPTDPAAIEPLIDHLHGPARGEPAAVEQAATWCIPLAGELAIEHEPSLLAETANEALAGTAAESMELLPIPAKGITADSTLVTQPPATAEKADPVLTEPGPPEPFIVEIPSGSWLTQALAEAAAENEAEEAIEVVEPALSPERTEIPATTVMEVVPGFAAKAVAAEPLARMEPAGGEKEETAESIAGKEPEAEEKEAGTEQEEKAGASGDQQGLLTILQAEIAQLAEAAEEVLTLATAVDGPTATRAEALSGYAEQLERLGDASAAIGLTGLQQFCTSLQTNLNQLATQDSPLNAEQRRMVEAWPALVLRYLQALDDRPTCAALAGYLQDTCWPQPLATANTALLIDLLLAPKLVTEEAEAEARPRQIHSGDVSLALPADVNQELVDGLLQELPHQAAEFSTAIQRLATGDGNLKDVEVARRIAHTLKGASNTVGVRGIATLTHHIEDILQALAKQSVLPNRPLAETLLNAADCLEAMSEALLGMGAPPSQAPAVFQEVLDWANRIDQAGIPKDDAISPPAVTGPEPAEPTEIASTTLQAAAPGPEATLRVPAHLVDDVLRLVGESIILTGQVQERIRKTIAQTRAMMGQNRLFQQLTAELEQLVDVRNVSSPLSGSMQRGDFDPLELEQYNELNTVTHRLVEAATDARELGRTIEENLAALDALLVDQGRLHRDNQEAVLRTRMVPIQRVVPRLQRTVRQTCRLVDKQAELVVHGADTLMDSHVLNNMVDSLMHLLRNAVDHGIEPPAQRQHLGKSPVGRIELGFGREGNNIVMRCQDDGAGLDLMAIRRAATERGLLAADQPLADDELARLILLPGFSTRGETTQTSGRGIGMDVVYSQLLAMKGSLRIQTRAGQGCLMELRLPLTLIATHALLARLRNQVYALSSRGIEQILHSSVGTIQKLGNATTFQTSDNLYELTSLDALLNLPPDRRAQSRATPPVLLVREETGTLHAVLVQEILDSRDLVVKSLGQYLPKLDGIVGATILGDGSVAPVLDLPELLRAPAVRRAAPPIVRAAAPAAPLPPRPFVLAVDDSLSARRSLAQFAQDAGFEVRTAHDGLEAIQIINSKRPDLVLADLEMPRMNGLELIAHLRANQATRDVPVIMITSRTTDKHRREAKTAGANVYLTKPFVEDELLRHIHHLLRPT